MTATVGSLFSGYGGIEMAITTTTDSRVIWNCQYDPYDSKQYAAGNCHNLQGDNLTDYDV